MRSRTRGAAERLLADLQLWAISNGASTWLIDLEPYVRHRIVGVVEHLRIDPLEDHIEITVTDGTAHVSARWPIGRPFSEHLVIPGNGVRLEGFARVDAEGELAFNAFNAVDLEVLSLEGCSIQG